MFNRQSLLFFTLSTISSLIVVNVSAAPTIGRDADQDEVLDSRGLVFKPEVIEASERGPSITFHHPNAPVYERQPYFSTGNGHTYLPEAQINGEPAARGSANIHALLQAMQDGHPNVRPVYTQPVGMMDARQQWQHQENQRFDRLLPQVNQAQANHPLEAHTQRQEVIDLVHPGYGSDTLHRRTLNNLHEAAVPARDPIDMTEPQQHNVVWLREDEARAQGLHHLPYPIPGPVDPSPASFSSNLITGESSRPAAGTNDQRGNINAFLRATGRQHVTEGPEAAYRNPHAEAMQRERLARNANEAVVMAEGVHGSQSGATPEIIDVEYPAYTSD